MRFWVVLLLVLAGIIAMAEARGRYGRKGRRYRYRPNKYHHYPGNRPHNQGCRYRKADCKVSSWHSWSSCSDPCGSSGTRHRVRYQTHNVVCGGKACPRLLEQQPCNRFCKNGGTPQYGRCSCRDGYKGKCCETAPPQNHCQWSGWGSWCKCSVTCGCGTRKRARTCKCDHNGNYGNKKRNYGSCHGNSKEEEKCNCHSCYGPHAKYVAVGCFKDKSTRALPNFIAKFHGHTSAKQEINACAFVAKTLRAGYFGLQDGGECWVDKGGHNHYDRYGKATNCKDGLGGGWSNSVYRML